MQCPYSDEAMNRLRNAILLSAIRTYKDCNRKSEYAYKKSLTSRQHISWNEKMFGYANEMVRELAFIISKWFVIVTAGKSPQKTIYNSMINITNEHIKDYVIENIEKYAERKNIDLTRLKD